MEPILILADKSIKPKEKTEILSTMLLDNSLTIDQLIEIAKKGKDPVKATCIEVMEYATQKRPEVASLKCIEFVSETLAEKAPRIKWESAKVIGNTCHLFPDHLEKALMNLLLNTEHSGTVVRWSAAYALGKILLIKHKNNPELAPTLESICQREEKNSIQKIYLAALKKVKK
jgi:hypothetical protein